MTDDAKDLPTLFSPETLKRKGLCRVTKVRDQEDALNLHYVYYELHGTGPERLVFVMGLNSRCRGFQSLTAVARVLM
jgi:hypothetical protein